MIRPNTPDPAAQFNVSSPIARATGANSRYACDRVRALPTANQKGVILQATDGHQAVCVLTDGTLTKAVMLPRGVLPNRSSRKTVMIQRQSDHWFSSDGRMAHADDEGRFPPIADVLPSFEGKKPVMLGIDVAILTKAASALGSSKICLFIVPPDEPRPNDPTGNNPTVTKPVGLCPADDTAEGIGVIMPLTPSRRNEYYENARKQIAKAETP